MVFCKFQGSKHLVPTSKSNGTLRYQGSCYPASTLDTPCMPAISHQMQRYRKESQSQCAGSTILTPANILPTGGMSLLCIVYKHTACFVQYSSQHTHTQTHYDLTHQYKASSHNGPFETSLSYSNTKLLLSQCRQVLSLL